jgi:glycosyltransferase involved in cell wall biosynthesis
VLISNYFYPCTLTPSQRISYWAQNFHRLGYFPTVITREWTADIKSHFDTKKAVGKEIRHEKFDNYEVYYLPFRPGILDKAYLKWGESNLRPLFLFVKFIDVALNSLTLRWTSFANIFPFLKQLSQNEKFDHLIISGEPFYLFNIGFKAKRQLGIPWVADYRDDWTTNELQRQKGSGFLRNILFNLEAAFEKRWVRTADHIISVSIPYTNRISKFLNVPGITIENGFEEKLLLLKDSILFEPLTVVYSGTIYPAQNISMILDALRLSVRSNTPFRLVFLGSGFDVKEKKRIEGLVEGALLPYIEVTERLPREEALNFLLKSHVMLGMAYGDMKGIPSSKLYEYIALRKPVLLCPNDHDIMEETLLDTGLGFYADNAADCLREINRIRAMYLNGTIDQIRRDSAQKILKYSRFEQMTKISQILDR